jgi:hypothetical protein
MFVIKFDGRKQEFSKKKIIRTCLRMHANLEQAKKIASKIESESYDGIRTKKIIKLIFKYLKKYRPEIKHKIDLRDAISMLRPKPDFEKFVSLLLKEFGYKVKTNQIIPGKCVDHEIDIIASKENMKILVEVKHHIQPHTYTGKDICLIAKAIYEDLIEGHDLGFNSPELNKILIVCNTKFSDHAKKYAKCRHMNLIGWKMPEKNSLEQLIEKKKFYPITFLKGLKRKTQEKFGDNGIVLVRQLVEIGLKELYKKTKVSKKELKELISKARKII